MLKHEGRSSEYSGGSVISTAVAIDKDKNSQFAVKWAIEKLNQKDKPIVLVHVRTTLHSSDSWDVFKEGREPTQAEMQQLFLPLRGICARKGVRAKELILHDPDVARGLSEYITASCISTIVLGAPIRGFLVRAFKSPDVPTSVAKCAPDFCDVYVASKGGMQKLKSSIVCLTPYSFTRSTPQAAFSSDSTTHATRFRPQESWKSARSHLSSVDGNSHVRGSLYGSISTSSPLNSVDTSMENRQKPPFGSPQNSVNSKEFLQAVRQHGGRSPAIVESANSSHDTIPFGCCSLSNDSGRGNTHSGYRTPPNRQPGCKISAMLQDMKSLNPQVQTKESLPYSASESGYPSEVQSFPSCVSSEIVDQSWVSDSSGSAASSQAVEIEDELRRLKQEFKQILLTYNTADQDALNAKDEGEEHVQENASAIIEREKLKYKAAIEVAQKAQRIAELESEMRKQAEMKFKQEAEERQKAIDALAYSEIRYRRYTKNEIEVATNYFSSADKIGEGGYGPVFKATLDHTPVAIKALRPDMSQGEKQFQREVEVLSCMRHPNMVILLGACPEYGCLVYEYMDNGSLEDRLYRRNGTQTLPWTTRFRIAAEIATALNFLHRTRPEPLVHRDLKPANILLDKNYVSKISDVGLSRLVPPSMADCVTQYHMTAAVGTFCYIDPEYQQTGMLGTKSDIYSLGVMLLQIITAKPPMGLTHHVETAIETGRFAEILDQTLKDWPVDEALSFSKLALKCCELRRRDRPDLDSVILPELQRLSNLQLQNKPDGRSHYMY